MAVYKINSAEKAFEESKKDNYHYKQEMPHIVCRSNIKMTKCARCKSSYQSNWDHIRKQICRTDLPYSDENIILVTQCPCCGIANKVEFEETKAIE